MKNEGLIHIFEEQISQIFERVKRLPNYGQLTPAFIAMPRKSDTFQSIKDILFTMNSDIAIESYKSTGNAHVVKFSGDFKIVIIYAANEEHFKWLYGYHSFSVSIILGKILKKAGLKYSEDGLRYVQYDLRENHRSEVGDILITRSFKDMLEILKLDVETFDRGFSNLNELFDFLIKTPYLNVNKFVDLEKEAKSYILQQFQEYLILNKLENRHFEMLSFERIRQIFTHIDFDVEIAKLIEKAEQKKRITDKFNGRVILDTIPGFDPKNIGISMSYFKRSFSSSENFTDFLCEHTSEEIISKFKEVNQLV